MFDTPENHQKRREDDEAARRERNDTLADMAAVEVLDVLTTPINGVPSVQIVDYVNARRLVKAALLATYQG